MIQAGKCCGWDHNLFDANGDFGTRTASLAVGDALARHGKRRELSVEYAKGTVMVGMIEMAGCVNYGARRSMIIGIPNRGRSVMSAQGSTVCPGTR